MDEQNNYSITLTYSYNNMLIADWRAKGGRLLVQRKFNIRNIIIIMNKVTPITSAAYLID